MTWRGPRATSYARSPVSSFALGARCHRRVGSSVIELAVGDGAGADSLKMVAESLLDGFVAGVGLERDVRPLFEPQERGKTFRGHASILDGSLSSPPCGPPYEADWAPSSLRGLNHRLRKSC